MDPRTYRAVLGAYGVFAAITGALSALWLTIAWRVGAHWLPVCVPLVGFALVALWLSRFRITFGDEELVVATPFGGARRLARGEILSVEFAEDAARGETSSTLCIRTSFGEELHLNAKLFSTEAIRRLLALSAPPQRARLTA